MNSGYAPRVIKADRYKSFKSFILHHQMPISEGGEVYDLSNIRVVTPSAHQTIHYGAKP